MLLTGFFFGGVGIKVCMRKKEPKVGWQDEGKGKEEKRKELGPGP